MPILLFGWAIDLGIKLGEWMEDNMSDLLARVVLTLLSTVMSIVLGAVILGLITGFALFLIWAWQNWQIGLVIIGILTVCWFIGNVIFDF